MNTKKNNLFLGLLKSPFKIISFSFSFALLLSYLGTFFSPDNLWMLQLFGLSYPVLLAGTVVSLILNFFINRKFIFAALVLIIGFPIHSRYFGIQFKSSTPPLENEFSVMSFNVRLFNIYDLISPPLISNKEEFSSFFTLHSPDILCIQEYAEDNTNRELISPKDIMEAAGYIDYTRNLTLEAYSLKVGQAIFSKYPILHSGKVKDSTGNIPTIYADIKKGEDTLRVYNIHLQSIRFQKDEYSLFDTSIASQKSVKIRLYGLLKKLRDAYPPRIKQMEHIIHHASESPYPVLIAGDFNEPPSSYIYAQFSKHFTDAFYKAKLGKSRTYAGKVPAGRIDYLFYDAKITANSFKILDEKEISDHYAVIGTFSH